MDPTTAAGYALMYMAAIAVIVVLLLPILVTFFLLLLVAGAVQIVVFLVKVATVSLDQGHHRALQRFGPRVPAQEPPRRACAALTGN